jgi:hypothetical protein
LRLRVPARLFQAASKFVALLVNERVGAGMHPGSWRFPGVAWLAW